MKTFSSNRHVRINARACEPIITWNPKFFAGMVMNKRTPSKRVPVILSERWRVCAYRTEVGLIQVGKELVRNF